MRLATPRYRCRFPHTAAMLMGLRGPWMGSGRLHCFCHRHDHWGLSTMRPPAHYARRSTKVHDVFRSQTVAHDSGLRGRIALADRCSACLHWACRHCALRLPRPVPGRRVPRRPCRELLLPLPASLGAIMLRAMLEQARTMLAHRTAARVQETLRGRLLRQDRRHSARLVRRRAHRRHDAVDGRRRRATADFLRPVPAATAHLRLRAIRHLRLHGVVGPAGRGCHAGAALFTLVLPSLVHRQNRRAAIARQQAFKAFGEEFLDAMQGLPTLKAFGQAALRARCWR